MVLSQKGKVISETEQINYILMKERDNFHFMLTIEFYMSSLNLHCRVILVDKTRHLKLKTDIIICLRLLIAYIM